MVQGRMRCVIHDPDDVRGQLGGIAASAADGGDFRWKGVGCPYLGPLDLAEWLGRCGPRYSMLNQIDVCPKCGAPRSLMWSRGPNTPYLPMKALDDEGGQLRSRCLVRDRVRRTSRLDPTV